MEQSFNHVLDKKNGYGPTLISSTSFISYTFRWNRDIMCILTEGRTFHNENWDLP